MKHVLAGVTLGIAGLALTAALGAVRPARADSLYSTRTDALTERVSRIALRFARDHAELTVQRSVFNAASISDQATWMIDMPNGAVATGLRTRSAGPGPLRWFVGELLEAEEAAKRYQELTGIGGYYPKDPALLSWRDQSLLALQVFPCPPHSEKLVEYTLLLPTEYRDGAYHVGLPALGTAERLADLDVQPARVADHVFVDGAPLAAGGHVHLSRDRLLDLSLVPAAAAPLEATLVSLPYATGSVLTRYAIRAAPQLSRLPEHAYIALVIDASRSTDGDFETAAKTALAAYLSHFEDARVEILTFDRHVSRVLGTFAPVQQARFALESLTLGRKNGSDVDQALFEADQLLASTPLGSPRRVVLVTDGLARSGLTGERLRGALGQSEAVVHVGLLDAGDAPELSREDDHPWASALRARHAMVWRASAPLHPNSELKSSAERVYEQWARPVRIDNLSVFSDNQRLLDQITVDGLAEGAGTAELYIDARTTHELSVTGELWVDPVRVDVTPNAADNPLWAALVFGSPLVYTLEEPQMMTLARLGGAVSPVTSYLAIEPGVRPSTEGLSDDGQGSHSVLAPQVRSGACSISGRGPFLDRQAYLERTLRNEYHRCGGAVGAYALELETTRDEVVSARPFVNQASPDPLVEACLTEAAWALALPAAFDEAWQTFRVDL